MRNKTKRDVFVNAVDALADAQASSDNNVGLGHQDADLFMAEYDAALPDDLPVIPKVVGEYIKGLKQRYPKRQLIKIFPMVYGAYNSDVRNWVLENSDTFALAWVLGDWEVEDE